MRAAGAPARDTALTAALDAHKAAVQDAPMHYDNEADGLLHITGGEPLVHPDVVEIAALLSRVADFA